MTQKKPKRNEKKLFQSIFFCARMNSIFPAYLSFFFKKNLVHVWIRVYQSLAFLTIEVGSFRQASDRKT